VSRKVIKLEGPPQFLSKKSVDSPGQKVAAYARVSTKLDEQESSLIAQENFYTKLIQQHPGWTFVKAYVDDGISGLSMQHRDAFNQMISDCEDGKIDLILTKSISRFARNTVDSVKTTRRLKEIGVGVYFEKEDIYTLDSKGEFILTLMASLAQEESRSISENVAWGHRKRFSEGLYWQPYSTFLGYDKGAQKYEMVVNEEEAVIVREIYRLFLVGHTPMTIARILTERGIRTPMGHDTWHNNAIDSILTNERYKGDALLQKKFTEDFLTKRSVKNTGQLPQYYVHGGHEAIITPWLFDYVQDEKKRRLNLRTQKIRYSGVTPFSTKIYCGKCGATFGPRPWHSTSYNNLVWQCRSRFRKENPCKTHNIYDKVLHYVLYDAMRKLLRKRGVEQTVMEVLRGIVPETRHGELEQEKRKFKRADVWTLVRRDEDIGIMLRKMTVTADGVLEIEFLDGTMFPYKLPGYEPGKMKIIKR